jgi:hypothetical protein
MSHGRGRSEAGDERVLTFQAFDAAADKNEKIREAILLRTTETIFGPQATGYLGPSDEPKGPTQILELVQRSGDEK